RDRGGWTRKAGRAWVYVEEPLAGAARENPMDEDNHRPAVGGAAYQAAESLLQTKSCLRQRQLRERVAYLLGPRREYRVARYRERKPDDDHTAQPLPGDVDTLPERRRAEEQRTVRLLESLEQLAAVPVH